MKKILFFLMTLLLGWNTLTVSAQQTLTVADGTTTNEYVPVYGFYEDEYVLSQTIYPSNLLTGMMGASINSITFYLNSSATLTSTFAVKLGTTSASSFSSSSFLTSPSTTVYSGPFTISGNQLTITFTTPFTYTGGNLLLEVYTVFTTGDDYEHTYFYGISSTESSIYSYDSPTPDYSYGYREDFLPKTTFNYGAPATCLPPSALTVDSITTSSVFLSWTDNNNGSYYTIYDMSDSSVLASGITDTSYEITNLTPFATYTFGVEADCGGGDLSAISTVTTYLGHCLPNPSSIDDEGITHVTFGNGSEVVNNSQYPTTSPYYGDYTAQVGAVSAGTNAYVDITFETGYTYGTLIWVDWNNSFSFEDNEIVYMGTSTNTNPTTLNASFNVPATQDTGLYRMRIGAADSYFDSYISGTASANHDPCSGGSYKVFHDYTLHVLEAPGCYPVTNLTVDSATSNSLFLSWTDANNSGASYTIYNMSDSSIIASNYSGNSYEVTGLSPITQYEFGVASNCSTGDDSFITTVAGQTACGLLNLLPYSTSFESEDLPDGSYVLPNCWTRYNDATGTYNYYPYSYSYSSYSHTGSRMLYFYSSTSTSYADTMIAVLPQVDETIYPLNTTQVSFWARYSSNPGSVTVGTMSNPNDPSTFVADSTIAVNSTTYGRFDVNLSNAPAGNSYAAFMVTRGSSYFYIYVDDVVLQEIPSCFYVSNAQVDSATSSSIVLSWADANNNGASYTIYNMDDNSVVASNISNTSYEITGLNANTLYTFGIEANCSPSDASEKTIVSGRTACGTLSVPYTETFEGMPTSSAPYCWTHLTPVSSSNNYFAVTSSLPHNGSKAVRFNYGSPTGNYVVMPSFNESLNLLRISLWYRAESTSSSCGVLEVGYMTDPTDTTTFVSVETLPRLDSYTYTTVNFTNAPSTASIAFRHRANTTNWYWNLDDITVEYQPSCEDITGLTVESLASDQVTLSWNATSADYYEVELRSDTSVINTDMAYDTVATFQNLTPETSYDIYVRGFCNGDTSVWSLPLSIYTGYCQPTPTSVDNNGITNVTFGTGSEVVNNNQHPTSSPYYGNYTTQVGAVPAGTTANVDITFQTSYTYGTLIWVDWNNNLTFEDNEIVYMGTSTNSNPTTLNASFNIPTTQDTGLYRMRIGAADSYFDSYISGTTSADHDPCSGGSYKIFHDYTLHVTDIPSCLPITNLTASAITSSSVTLTWADSRNSGATYTIYDMSDSSTIASNIADTTYTITGLTANTSYTFGVQTDCGGDLAIMVTVDVQTSCDAFPIPFTEGFENGIGCWTMYNCYYADSYYNTGLYGNAAHSGSYGFRFYYTINPPQYLISPEIVSSSTPLQLEFEYKIGNSSYPETFKVGYSTTTNDVSAFTWGQPITISSTTWTHFADIIPAGTKYIAIQCTSYDQYYLYIDDISIDVPPTCLPVTALTVDATTSNSVTLSWTDANNTGATYSVYDMANPTTPVAQNISTLSYTVTGLTAATAYTFGVQTDCGGGDTATMVTVLASTDCDEITTFPYTEGFENGLGCWQAIDNDNDGHNWFYHSPSASSSIQTHSGTGMAVSQSYYYDGYSENPLTPDNFLISPKFHLPASSTITLSWYFLVDSAYSADKYSVYVATGNSVADFTTPLQTIIPNPTNDWTQQTLDLSAYAGQQVYIAFRHHDCTDQDFIALDDIMITAVADSTATDSCQVPTGLTATDISMNSVLLTWTENGTATSWTVSYKVDGASNWNTVAATSNPYTLSGLQPETTYSVFVVANCSDGDSDPSNTVTFTTLPDGIAEYEMATSLYPNPNNGQFTINNEQCVMNNVQIYDAYGKLLRTVEVNGNTVVINANELSSGIYFVRINTEKGIVTKRFLKK